MVNSCSCRLDCVCVSFHDWLTFQSSSRIQACMTFEVLCVYVLTFMSHLFVDLLIWTKPSLRLYFEILSYVYYLLQCILLFFPQSTLYYLDFAIKLFLAEPDKWLGVWVGGSRDTYVVVLFWYYLRSPHFPWAPAACLSSFCVIWFRGCICSCPPSGTVRGS